MEERAKKAEAGRKRKQRAVEAAKEAWYRENAIDLLSKQSGWTDLPDEEKIKKLHQRLNHSGKKITINLQNQLQKLLPANLPGTKMMLRKLPEDRTLSQMSHKMVIVKCNLLKIPLNRKWHLPIPLTARSICLI